MANITGERSDNSRHVNEGMTVAETNQDDGQFDAVLDFKNGRQAMPNPHLQGDGQYNGTLAGIPDPTLPGDPIVGDGSTVGGEVDFGAVAPYHWGEFPKDDYKVGLNDSPSGLDSAVGA